MHQPSHYLSIQREIGSGLYFLSNKCWGENKPFSRYNHLTPITQRGLGIAMARKIQVHSTRRTALQP